MSNILPRRQFMQTCSATALSLSASLGTSLSSLEAWAENNAPLRRVVVGVMGLNRGRALARLFAAQPEVEVRYLCDTDQQRVAAGIESLSDNKPTNERPQGVGDFRRILDDKEVDVLVCAAPNHWHAPATILGCQAGKHVYVEKPCSHNPWEGEAMVQAARTHQRMVQLGTQRRSSTGTQLAIERLHDGAIGKVYLAEAVYRSARGSIGTGKPAAVPETLNFELWQGPAPRRDYVDNLVHYNWHWRWHWGNGELGNNGIHTLDLCRWGLNVVAPQRVVSSGGRYAFQDDQETPDTQTVSYEFASGQAITWQGLSCNRHRDEFVTFYGTDGTLALDANGNFKVYDSQDKLQEEHQGSSSGESAHVANFLAAVRADKRELLSAEIEQGHFSTLLCHLGNISQRTGRALHCDPTTGRIQNDELAMELWKREYAPGWEPRV